MTKPSVIRLGVDIGGTFTDIALDVEGDILSAKVLTSHDAPEKAIIDGISLVTQRAGISLGDIDAIVHGTTLAANALIERRGAKTAFITTDGFRDVIEMRTENRFDQYDLNIQLTPPVIARQHRYPIAGRIDAAGCELQPIDEDALEKLTSTLVRSKYESVAIGFLHSYLNGTHERRAKQIVSAALPGIPISLSCEVSPQMREYSRFSTVCVNAYVRPRIERYLSGLQDLLRRAGADCPLYVIHCAGGLISVETAKRFPVRLIESGPAGGAIFAAELSRRFGFDKVVSFDMGGTTAKICLIENFITQTSREFEVARSHRFCKGSGIPISIPVIDMIEIGAGGGSIAWTDAMARIQIGPQSAGSEPGPACYRRGGDNATVTDADLVLGKIDENNFAGGAIQLSKSRAIDSIEQNVSDSLKVDATTAAFGICEMVDENMANAARVHAVENGKDISQSRMIAFGGGGALHAARVCEKLGITSCLIPNGAGVGSAIGFVQAAFSYEAVASRVIQMSKFDVNATNALLSQLMEEAESFVRQGTSEPFTLEITVFMRYQGQGWEIPVPLPSRLMTEQDGEQIIMRFETCYREFFGRTIDVLDDLEIEIVNWSVKAAQEREHSASVPVSVHGTARKQTQSTTVFDSCLAQMTQSSVFTRDELKAGDTVIGPAIIVEQETSTIVTSRFDAVIQQDRSILLNAKQQ